MKNLIGILCLVGGAGLLVWGYRESQTLQGQLHQVFSTSTNNRITMIHDALQPGGLGGVMLLLGQFNYGKAGILDRTHTRLFTFRTLRYLLANAGFRIDVMKGVPAPFPKVFGDGVLGRSLTALNLLGIRLSRTFFSYQIFVVATPTPDVDFILEDDRQRSAQFDRETA